VLFFVTVFNYQSVVFPFDLAVYVCIQGAVVSLLVCM